MTPRFGCVVLTMGDRPDELHRAVGSILAQKNVEVDVVVVGNGWIPTGLPEGVKSVGLVDNVGIPAGRNSGVPSVDGDFLVFVDDDACLPEPDVLARLAALFDADPSLGLVQPRFADPDGRPTPRHWVPRLRKGDAGHSSDVCAVCEAVVVLPRAVFDTIGGWPETFWYAHEGIDLAWRVWDSGHRVRYVGDVVVHHPAVAPQRHADFYRYNSRNRVLLARRNLPAAGRGGVRDHLGPAHAPPHPQLHSGGAVAARVPRGLQRAHRPSPPAAVAHDLADDAGRAPAGDLTR